MTKAEIAETQVIVTTPEKWDVVTRKPTGEGEIASVSLFIASGLPLKQGQVLKLLIIDEVHLLNDERGAVIETIVARTLRQVDILLLDCAKHANTSPGGDKSNCYPNCRTKRNFTQLYRCC